MSKSSTAIIVILLAIIALLGWMVFTSPAEAPTITTPVTTDTPADTTPDPVTTQKPLHDRVVVTYPKPNASVPKKFTITGKAPGNWFFEASAPYMIQTPAGDKIASGITQAIGEWMTTELVDFKGDVIISGAYTGPATLVLMKDNPSGMPENDDSLEIAIQIQ